MSQHWNYLSPTIVAPGMDRSLIKACYQFDGPDQGLVDRTGNGHDLSKNGVCFSWHPSKAEFGSNGIFISNGNSWLSSPLSSELGTLGEATLEFVYTKHRLATLDDTYNGYVGLTASGSLEESNSVFSVFGGPTRNRAGIFVERNGGVNVDGYSPNYWQIGLSGQMTYIAFTRDADGVTYHFYADGVYLEDIVLSYPPTGGTNIRLSVGAIVDSGSSIGFALFNSVRWSHAKLLPEQITETYRLLRTPALAA